MVNYEENIYNRITTYYDISEKIKVEILKLEDISDSEKFDILMPIVSKIKETADLLMEKYVVLLKNKNNSIRKEIVTILDQFLEYITIYKNKLYEIYNNKQ
ncbi:MAG: hypothetical protein J6C50_02525 [Rickettsiales bacterium]|nr:hypothetical protein [Rickettsiales bacterium]